MEFLTIFAVNALFTIGLVGILTAILVFAKKSNFKYYAEVKMALMLVGMSLRDDKMKTIASIALEVVKMVESINVTPQEKKALAIKKLSLKISKEMEMELDEAVLDLIIDVAVATLPPTNK